MIRAVFALLSSVALATAQPPREDIPLPLPAPAAEPLPGGTDISRPLRPTAEQFKPAPAELLPPESRKPDPPPRVIARNWWSVDYLMAWTQSTTLPALATANMFASPVLGDPNTVTLLGGRQPRGMVEGVRVVTGSWTRAHPLAGYEIAYHTLGTHTLRSVVGGGGSGGEALLGRPLFDPRTGREDVVPISHPRMFGELGVGQSLRVSGWEAVGLRQVFANQWVEVAALAGYRYFQVHDGLRLDQRSEYYGPPVVGTGVATYRSSTADQFDAHNRFHGGTLGVRTRVDLGGLFAQLDTKVSLGRVTEIVRASGQTVSTIDSPGGTTVSYFPNGVYGQPTNSGRISRGTFAVLPEANLRLGYAFTDTAWLVVGYQFSYLSDAVRAADQLDRVVDLPGADPLALVPPPTRPRVPFARTDFWVQGVSLGLEWRY